MKLCEKCQLNYVSDNETFCEICKTEQIKAGVPIKSIEYEKNLVSCDKITNRISANAVFLIVRYLTSDYGEYDIYKKDYKWSYRKLLDYLRKNFSYSIIKFSSKSGFSYIFDSAEIWEKFLLCDNNLMEVINHRRIKAMDELTFLSRNWHLSKYKTRPIK